MKKLFAIFIALFAFEAYANPISGMIDGGNRTEFVNQQGMVNNNQWNIAMNPTRAPGGAGAGGASADFQNCHNLILRTATTRCGQGCMDMNTAIPIVTGVLQQNAECQRHGDTLIQGVAGQIVAANTARAQQGAAAAQQAAAQQQAAAGAQQMEQMTAQMQQMQQQMAQQQQQAAAQAQQQQAAMMEQMQQMQAQQAQAAAQQAAAAPAQSATVAAAIDRGVPADTIARNTIIGQVMSALDGVTAGMNAMRAVVEDVRTYAGCDHNATNCTGPGRVSVFRQKARPFFEHYDNVLDALESSLITAMSAGVDVTDIYMMLTNACNQWGKYMCNEQNAFPIYFCPNTATGIEWIVDETRTATLDNSHMVCVIGATRPRAVTTRSDIASRQFTNPGCTFIQLFRNDQRNEIQQNWIIAMGGDQTNIRMACMSDGVLQTGIFGRRNRRRVDDFDIDALELLINQAESPTLTPRTSLAEATRPTTPTARHFHYGAQFTAGENCAVTPDQITTLETAVQSRSYHNVIHVRSGGQARTIQQCLDGDMSECQVNPLFALCNTHVFNIGEADNCVLDAAPTGQATATAAACNYRHGRGAQRREEMNRVIGLKSTVVAQNLKRQYDFMNATVRQIRTTLQRAVMTAEAEQAGAAAGGVAGAGGAGGQGGVALTGAQNCFARISQMDRLQCLSQNLGLVTSAMGNHVTNEVRNQLRTDSELLDTLLGGFPADSQPVQAAGMREGCARVQGVNEARTCIQRMQSGINFVENQLRALEPRQR